ncbi:MAG: hypothetical protein ACRDIU_03015, partial [Actinomycetota bacterium]
PVALGFELFDQVPADEAPGPANHRTFHVFPCLLALSSTRAYRAAQVWMIPYSFVDATSFGVMKSRKIKEALGDSPSGFLRWD